MARFPEVISTATPSAGATLPQVFINGSLQRRVVCTACDETIGTTPGKAVLQIHAEGLTVRGPVTLGATMDEWRKGARVKVARGEDVYFLGCLISRGDQGAADAIAWNCLDDRWILSRLPVRGALVYDGGSIKFLSRYLCRTNPAGRWNCTGASYGGRIWPVFSATAEQHKGYVSSEATFPSSLSVGELGPWTPRRFLQYLRLLMYCERDGWNALTHYRNLEKSTRIEWPENAADAISGDAGDGAGDSLDRKMPDETFRGSVLGALDKALKIAGTHALRLHAVGDVSRVEFADVRTCPETALDIPILRGGVADDTNTAFDFELSESCEKVAESVLLEGEPRRVEAQFEYDPAGTKTITRAWTDTQEDNFKRCIWGAAEGHDKGDWALIPASEGATPSLACNGTSGRPYAVACTTEAVAVARKLYPQVYCEFIVDSLAAWNAGILTADRFGDAIRFPCYSGGRQVLPEQLQHILLGSDFLAQAYPVRVQVKGDGAARWYECPYADGFKATPVSFRLSGLAETANGSLSCLYSGSLYTDPWACEARAVRVNMAVPLDHRVSGYAEVEESELDASLLAECNGPIQDHIGDSAYREDMQVNSYPSAQAQFPNEGETQTAGITGDLPPGSEAGQATAAAARALAARRHVERRSSWKLVGIRPDYRAGLWVRRVAVRGGSSDEADYELRAPLRSVAWDFLRQTTHAGGLVSALGRAE